MCGKNNDNFSIMKRKYFLFCLLLISFFLTGERDESRTTQHDHDGLPPLPLAAAGLWPLPLAAAGLWP